MTWEKLLASIPRDANGAIKPITLSTRKARPGLDPGLQLALQKLLDEFVIRNRAVEEAERRQRFIDTGEQPIAPRG
jgi:hypothetical protein